MMSMSSSETHKGHFFSQVPGHALTAMSVENEKKKCFKTNVLF